jgi:hypothetical protein
MGGYGVDTVNGIVQAWGIISEASITACTGLEGSSMV